MKDMLTYATDALGRLGVSEVQIGSTVLPVIAPNELDKLEGFGDTLRKGDFFTRTDDFTPINDERGAYPLVVEAILAPGPGEESPSMLARRIDEGPLQKYGWGPTSFNVFGAGWKRTFVRLDQEAVDRWFEVSKGPKPDGWHRHPDMHGVAFHTLAGVPVEVKCGTSTFKYVAEEVGRITGYDLKLSGRFTNKETRTMPITKVARREPPKVPPKFIVRLFDMFDGWVDATEPLPHTEALAYWNERTANGTKKIKYEDGDYWRIFPEGTHMLMTPEFLGR